jgi:hypothetical protein
MAYGQTHGPNAVLDKTFKVASSTTITGWQVVKGGTHGGEVTLASANTDIYLGVAQVNPNEGVTYTAGEFVTVRMLGITKAIAAEAISSGTRVTAIGAAGGITDTTGAGYTGLGIALEEAYSTGDVIDVLLTPGTEIHD